MKGISTALRLAVLAGFRPGEGIGVDDEGAFFAFADLSAQLVGLSVGEPEGIAVAAFHRRCPQHQHIHAAIGCAAGTQGAGDRPCLVACLPGLQPGEAAALQVGDDFTGHAGVDVLFLGHGTALLG